MESGDITARPAEETDAELYNEIKELIHAMRQLRDTRVSLEGEAGSLREECDSLNAELKGMDIVIAATASDIQSNDYRSKGFLDSIERLSAAKERLTEDVNNLQFSVKGVTGDVNNCLTLKRHLEEELSDIDNEKALVMNKLKGMEDGVGEIAKKKAEKLPHLKTFDVVLKSIHNELKEIENRMDVSLKFIQHGQY
jgi:chromosome segregation ATPase